MTKEELDKILELHKLWLDSKGKEGKRGNLEGANLQGVDLRGVDLRGVNLEGAILDGAIK